MKIFWSSKGMLVSLLVALVVLVAACSGSQGTAGERGATGPQGVAGAQGPAGEQGATGPQGIQGAAGSAAIASASIVTSPMCVLSTKREDPQTLTVWGSGWASGELVLISAVVDADTSKLLLPISANESGAFELPIAFASNPTTAQNGSGEIAKFPGAGLLTLAAEGLNGGMATAPVMFVLDKCPA